MRPRAVLVLAAGLAVTSRSLAQAPADTTHRDSTATIAPSGDRSLSQSLMARLPGLLVSPAPGTASGGARLRMRGPQTIIDSRMPLVIVDGVRVDASESGLGFGGTVSGTPRFDDFVAGDIARIEVVPGAAAAGRYGPDAANGVLLIETRAGALGAGRPRWQLTFGQSARPAYGDWPTNFAGIDNDNPVEQYHNGGCRLAWDAEGSCTQDSIKQFRSPISRRQFQTGWRQQVGLRVWGGSRRLGYQLAGETEDDNGVVALAPFEAGRLRAIGEAPDAGALHPDNNRRWNLRANVDLKPRDDLDITLRGARFSGSERLPPVEQLLRASLTECCGGNADSMSTAFARLFQRVNQQTMGRWFGTLESRWRRGRAFAVRALIGRDDVTQQGVQAQPDATYVAEGLHHATTLTYDLAAEYDRAASPRVRLHTTAGAQYVALNSRRDGLERFGREPITFTAESTVAERRRETGVYLYQRVELDRSLAVTAGVRRDWLRAFGGASAPGTHPSLTASWLSRGRVLPGVASLRLHAGYGTAGRRPIFRAMRQEQTGELEAGFEAVLGSGINLGATAYAMRSDVYTEPIRSIYTNAGVWPSMMGVVSNQGLEVTLGGRLLARPGLALDATLSGWANRNRVERMITPPFFAGPLGVQAFQPGLPLGAYFATPVRSYSDVNGDGLISSSEVVLGDPRFIGSPYPTHGAMLGLALAVGHGIHIDAALEYRGGNRIFNYTEFNRCFDRCRASVDASTPLGDQASIAWSVANPRFFERADFIKVRAIAVTADAPTGISALFRARALSLTLTGRNLWTWTGYTHGDPEAQMREATIGSPEAIESAYLVPPLAEWSIRVRLTY